MENTTKEVAPPPTSLALQEVEARTKAFELSMRMVRMFAKSDIVPAAYKGNDANCAIAIELAERMKITPMAVMQNLDVIHGRPSWRSEFAIALFNNCGRFSALRYKFDGEGDSYGCTAYTTEKATGELIESPKITWAMVKAEGWLSKNGSKWKTMPELMFRYRAAAFLIRTTAPELLFGVKMTDENEDILMATATAKAAPNNRSLDDIIGEATPVAAEVVEDNEGNALVKEDSEDATANG